MLRNLWSLPPSQFAGLGGRCAPGTHEAAADLICHHVDKSASVLDLAAGTGAFLARLSELGFTGLSAVELDPHSFGFPSVTPRAIDLNAVFGKEFDRQFDLITAIEIIEHLDSPRHFLKQIWELLKPDGHLVVSTPNIAHWFGRVRFALHGEHRYFRERDYHWHRHISPISDLHMRLMLKEIGFDLLEFTTAGSFYGPLKRAVTAPAAALSRLLLGPLSQGDVCMYVGRKTKPDTESTGRNSQVNATSYRHPADATA
ncbi:MAG TPA: class I SAM-dependent methyltransferase [Tepidisphaeraceae bacterium]|jgi:SAM-dependent methyltransferase|nr:class I SAM-dependent methyltransferase [Tepidisphaeraceae bacterium]